MSSVPAQAQEDEAKVPPYTLPDVLRDEQGGRIESVDAWRAGRRAAVLDLLARHEYGRTPGGRFPGQRWEVTAYDATALGGRATRKEVTLWLTGAATGPRLRLLLYVPNGVSGPRPVFLGLNFFGNHTVHADPGISLADPLVTFDVDRYRPAPATPSPADHQRGVHAGKWQIESVLARGFASATVWCFDACPDRVDGLKESVPAAFATGGAEDRADEAWGAIGVWAWALSRAMDALAEDADLDARRVVVHGFSRLGKAALWAGAQDERFAAVVSFQSGCGGAALHKRVYGETVRLINDRFPHWFSRSFRRFNDRETELPFDQHHLLSLIAPRPLYVTSAEEDRWSDPRGEFLGLIGAEPVYALYGRRGLGVAHPPAVGRALMNDALGYHCRSGKHDVTAFDWERVMDFCERALGLEDIRLARRPPPRAPDEP
ncbi:MAG TPA: acetylxylan esterase [Opitutaceae bacterium]|nr:acetylxylan esterase [Opitutaceae bacterium]HRE08601.1 acetylxylan esterase [Opitutaceae bacterium]